MRPFLSSGGTYLIDFVGSEVYLMWLPSARLHSVSFFFDHLLTIVRLNEVPSPPPSAPSNFFPFFLKWNPPFYRPLTKPRITRDSSYPGTERTRLEEPFIQNMNSHLCTLRSGIPWRKDVPPTTHPIDLTRSNYVHPAHRPPTLGSKSISLPANFARFWMFFAAHDDFPPPRPGS